MAEKANYFTDNSSFVQGGLNTDDSPLFIAEGDWTYALNAWLTNNEGTCSFMNNYPSNEVCVTLKDNYIIIGSRRLSDGRVVIFSTDNTSSEIGILSAGCSYATLINNACLNFNSLFPAQIEFTERFDCGMVIYWTDYRNPRRYLNLDEDLSTFNCDSILVNPIIDTPCIGWYEVLETGILTAGSYQFTIQYADINGSPLSHWMDLSNPIPIYNSVSTGNFTSILGSPSSEITSKSIRLSFANLDTQFSYFNLAVVKTIAGIKTAEQIITTALVFEYLYTGFEPVTTLTLEEVLILPVNYNKFKSVTQSNGYLLWGHPGLRKDPNFQPIANDILVNWVVKKTPAYWTSVNSKHPQTTTYTKGLMRDEVYAVGIRLIYSNGLKTNVYHIPGRDINPGISEYYPGTGTDQYSNAVNALTWDEEVNGNTILPHAINPDNPETINQPRWKIYNTASVTGFTAGYVPGLYEQQCAEYGETAYWESTLTYPNEPTVWNNGVVNLAGQPIRHHKMPDCSVIPLMDDIVGVKTEYDEPFLNYLGLNITNIQIPATSDYDDIIGWEIVIGDRTGNKSIVAKGMAVNAWHYVNSGTNYYYQAGVFNDPTTTGASGTISYLDKDKFSFYSPDTMFKKPVLTGTLKAEKISRGLGINKNLLFADQRTELGIFHRQLQVSYTQVSRVITDSVYMAAQSNVNMVASSFSGILSGAFSESCVWLDIDGYFTGWPNNDNSFTILTAAAAIGYTYDVQSTYSSIKIPNISQWGDISSIMYMNSGACPVIKTETEQLCYFEGDTFLTNFTFHKLRIWDMNTNVVPPTPGDNVPDKQAFGIFSCWVESSINTELRHEGTGAVSNWEAIYPNLLGGTITPFIWHLSCVANSSSTDVTEFHDNYLGYNFDYSILNNFRVGYAQPLDYTTDDCDSDLKTRVTYSLRQQQESKADNWLIYRPNDYYDFPKDSGELWDMRGIEQDKILFRFTNALYEHMAYETMETSANTVELGTGAIFAKEPKKLVSTDTGYAGTKAQFAFNSTEFGHFMVDSERGNVFKMDKSLNPISNIKCFNFFSKDLPLKLLKSFPDFPYIDNTADPRGIGFASIYDPKYKIWLLTKKDYKPIVEGIVWTGTNFSYRTATGDVEPELTDPTYFCEQSYTIGYDCLRNRWISFYSFIPDSYIQDTYSYKSAKGNKIYTHNIEGSYCIYFDEPYDHIVELPFKFKGQITNKTSIQFLTESFEYVDGDPYSYEYSTFNRAIVYNNEQNTGYLDLVVPDNTNLSTILNQTVVNAGSITIPVQKAGKQIWKFSDLWDRIANRTVVNPMFIKSCTPSVDKELNQACINYQKSWYDLKRISSPWAKCRLFFSDTDKNLITQIGTAKEKIDIF